MVNLLTESGCSRYLEFKAVGKICILQDGQVEQVIVNLLIEFNVVMIELLESDIVFL